MLRALSIFVLFIITNTRAQYDCYYDGNDFCINQDDILSVDLMPGSFLLVDQASKKNDHLEKIDNFTIDGSMNSALDKMDFHRRRMNEYLCHGFMAEEIFREMKTTRIKRRPNDRDAYANSLPDFFPDTINPDRMDVRENEIEYSNENDNVTVQHKLLSDEGSAKYKDWLQRTTTLDDVYRHYGPQKKLKKKFGVRHPPGHTATVIQGHGIEEFDGEVTGYAMPASISPDKTVHYYDSPEDHIMPSSTGHSYHNYAPHDYHSQNHHHADLVPIIHEEHYYEQPSHHDEEYWHRPSYHGKGKHELTIKDFFEIALTALAFLAFGLFVIQLLMNITNANMTMAPTVVADTAANRFRRDAKYSNSMNYANNEELNELSHRVLRSIEAALVAERDSGRCLRWSLCTDNHHSRDTSGPRKIWLPVWSLGMSWVSGRILNRRAWPTMLESVKASVLGLGGADCSSIYPDCDLARERIKRRRRRRK